MRGTARGTARRIMGSTGSTGSTSSRLFRSWARLAPMVALLMALLIVGSVQTAGAAYADPADPSAGSMHVVVPAPLTDNKTVQGTVGTNVSISAGQATANATYNLGWASQATGCASPITPFTDTPSVTADDGGNFAATFAWPDAAGTPGALYVICASDSANPTDVITADQVFQVLSSSSPMITLTQAPSSTTSGKKFNAGGPVEVRGSGFYPQGTAIAFFVTSRSTFAPQDYQSDNALKTEDGSPVTSDGQGQFTAVVTLPNLIIGQLFMHAVSTDAILTGQNAFPPSLTATRAIQIIQAEATPTVQPSPTPKTQKDVTPPGAKNTDHTRRIVAIATLGVLSIILFIIGGILVASSVIGPRTPPKLDSGTRAQRAQPTGVRSDQGW